MGSRNEEMGEMGEMGSEMGSGQKWKKWEMGSATIFCPYFPNTQGVLRIEINLNLLSFGLNFNTKNRKTKTTKW